MCEACAMPEGADAEEAAARAEALSFGDEAAVARDLLSALHGVVYIESQSAPVWSELYSNLISIILLLILHPHVPLSLLARARYPSHSSHRTRIYALGSNRPTMCEPSHCRSRRQWSVYQPKLVDM